MAQQPTNNVQTIEITQLGGPLTRKVNGDMNSGLAKYSSSFGYDPFTAPNNLTWYEKPVDYDPAASSIVGLITGAQKHSGITAQGEGSGTGYLYAIDHLGNFYRITANNTLGSSNISAASIIAGSAGALTTYVYGGGVEIWGNNTTALQQVYCGGDTGIERFNFDGSGRQSIQGTATSSFVGISSVTTSGPRPLQQFSGNLLFGNANNIGQIGAASIVNSFQQLSPPPPPGIIIRDLEGSSDLNYLLMLASYVSPNGTTAVLGDRNVSASGDAYIFQWNGSDAGITAGIKYPTFMGGGIHSFLDKQIYVSMDSLGTTIVDGATKRVTLPNVRPPYPNAIGANGNMFYLAAVEQLNGTLQASLFYYGQFDDEMPVGLWRLFSVASTQTNGWVESIPWQTVYSGKQPTTDNASSILGTMEGKHIFSALDVSNGGGTSKFKLYTFALASTGTGTPQLGVYETQTQLFSQKITAKQIRVYTESTAANQGFQIDFIGSDGSVITNGTFTYTFASGTDTTKLQGSLERVDFNPAMKSTYALGLRITNTGTANMTIHKIEIDYVQSGK